MSLLPAFVTVISLTSRAKGSLRINKSVDRWYLRISFKATWPGRDRLLGVWAPGRAPAAAGVDGWVPFLEGRDVVFFKVLAIVTDNNSTEAVPSLCDP